MRRARGRASDGQRAPPAQAPAGPPGLGTAKNPFLFYPRLWWETAAKTIAIARDFIAFDTIGKRIAAEPAKGDYRDRAILPVTEEDDDELELLTRDEATRAAVRRYREVRRLAAADAPGASA